METQSRFFQLALVAGFGIMALLGVLFFAGIGGLGGSKTAEAGPVTIWGTVPQSVMNSILEAVRQERDDFGQVKYVEKDGATYYADFVEAVAAGRGPDLLLVGQDAIYNESDKITPVAFSAYPERTFKDTFIQEGELFVDASGILAFPFRIDPLVMYWNRDLLQSAGVSEAPAFWDEFYTIAPKVTKKDQSFAISKSAVALGEFSNIRHAKDIFSALLFQAGTPITSVTDKGVVAVLSDNFATPTNPSQAALRFYTEFADPVRSVYSWNRSLPNSRDAFVAGTLAVYFGYASELGGLRKSNPNLNFDVALFPQTRGADTRVTFGSIEGFAIPRQSVNQGGAFVVAQVLTDQRSIALLSEKTGLPPVRRDLLAVKPGVAHLETFYDSALIAKGWLDPNTKATDTIFKDMIEAVLSGSLRISDATGTANRELSNLLR